MFDAETRIDREEAEHAATEQQRAGQQHDRERDLADDEAVAQTTHTADRASTGVAQRFIHGRLAHAQRRHEADYDVSSDFNRTDTVAVLKSARAAFEAWERVRGQQAAAVFLANLLLGSKWKR